MSSATATRPLPAADLRHAVDAVGDAWERLRGKRVLITGAGGFVGRWMHHSLHFAGKGGEALAEVEVCFRERPAETIWPVSKPDYVVHATTDGVGWQHVAAIARAAGARMLLLSSGAVYDGNEWDRTGSQFHRQPSPWKEDERGPGSDGTRNARTEYGCSKREQEHACRDVAVIARLFSFIGPGLRRHAGHEFVTSDLLCVSNDGAVRSYLHAADMCAWLWRALLLGQVGRAYNVGSGEPTKVADFAQKCADVRGMKLTVGCPSDRYLKDVPGAYYVPDVGRAGREPGCRQLIGLDDAIRRTVAWYKN